MSQSEFETKMVPMIGVACIIVAIIAFAVYLTSPNVAGISLVGSAVFLVIGIAFLGAWAWKRWANKIGQSNQRVMR